jgi:hypothetical protein
MDVGPAVDFTYKLPLFRGATPNAWVVHPAMKFLAEFEQRLKKRPPIAPDGPDPYMPAN